MCNDGAVIRLGNFSKRHFCSASGLESILAQEAHSWDSYECSRRTLAKRQVTLCHSVRWADFRRRQAAFKVAWFIVVVLVGEIMGKWWKTLICLHIFRCNLITLQTECCRLSFWLNEFSSYRTSHLHPISTLIPYLSRLHRIWINDLQWILVCAENILNSFHFYSNIDLPDQLSKTLHNKIWTRNHNYNSVWFCNRFSLYRVCLCSPSHVHCRRDVYVTKFAIYVCLKSIVHQRSPPPACGPTCAGVGGSIVVCLVCMDGELKRAMAVGGML